MHLLSQKDKHNQSLDRQQGLIQRIPAQIKPRKNPAYARFLREPVFEDKSFRIYPLFANLRMQN